MRLAITIVLAIALLAHLVSYGALMVSVGRKKGLKTVPFMLVIPPMAALWGYENGQRRWAVAYLGSLVLYVLAVALA